MLSEVIERRYTYGNGVADVRVFVPPSKEAITVTKIFYMGQWCYCCTKGSMTFDIDGEYYWGHGKTWEQALDFLNSYSQIL